jgi:hypothetical protein
MIIEITLFAMASLALAFTLLPLLRPPGRLRAGDENAEDLFIAKERVYANIKDLDFDHQVGKIDHHDHQVMRQALKQEAEAILAKIDQLKGGSARVVLEREIARRRKGAHAAGCPGCGSHNPPGARFCTQCGHRLS